MSETGHALYNAEEEVSRTNWIVVTLVMFAILFAIGVAVDDLGALATVRGATTNIMLAYVFPTVIFFKLRHEFDTGKLVMVGGVGSGATWWAKMNKKRMVEIALIFGCISCLCASTWAIYDQAEEQKEEEDTNAGT